MKALSLLAIAAILISSGCNRGRDYSLSTVRQEARADQRATDVKQVAPNKISLNQVEKVIPINDSLNRRIIRDADLTMEVQSTSEAQQRVTSIAENLGGFVVTSEAKQRESTEPAKRIVDIKLVLRVPSNQFNSALEQIEKLANNLPQRSVTGQDVTEEFIDLEARIKTERALELQFLEIMKQANKVADALEVQRQIADVRTEIERLEGRKRFLENRSSLSTITVNIQTPAPIVVTASGFRHSVREATSESIEIASGIVLFFVRFLIVMAPILLFVLLPTGLVALYFKRRAQRIRLAHDLEANSVSD